MITKSTCVAFDENGTRAVVATSGIAFLDEPVSTKV
jgi:hypothetical protein